MKAVILAGGLGTRLSEETNVRPKPMVEIAGRPILWHIMKIYSAHGINEFIICCGYKGYMIKEYFANYRLHTSDITFDLAKDQLKIHRNETEPWTVTLVDTGEGSMTGGRLKRVQQHLNGETFCFTYGDGLSDLVISETISFHLRHGKAATVTVVQPPGRFGAVEMKGSQVLGFREKPQGDGGWINGGFFVLNPRVFDYIESDATVWEKEPMERLAKDGQLEAFVHGGFWHPMDTLRDKHYLESLWVSEKAPWKIW